MIDINKAKLNLLSSGFLNIHIDFNLDLFKEINILKEKKNAVILAHYYQIDIGSKESIEQLVVQVSL